MVFIMQKLSQEDFVAKLKNLKLLSVDADGTLTDGGIYIDNNGNQLRKFYAQDGVGIRMIQELGIKVVLLTTSQEKVFSIRSEILSCDSYISGCFNKGEALEKLCNEQNISLENTIHMGDDINDISAFLKVGLPVAVNNAVPVVKEVCKYVTKSDGGKGAVREVCDLITIAKTGYPFSQPYVSEEVYKKLITK